MSRSKSDSYRVLISNGAGVDVIGDLPEVFALSVSQAFESSDQAITASSLAGSGALGQALDTFGLGAQVQAMSYALWKGSSPIEFSLQLLFDAETNSREDVSLKIAQLVWLSLPDNDTMGPFNMLTPPIPPLNTFAQGLGLGKLAGAGSPISVRIGRQYLFPSVAISNVTASTETRMHNGFPIAGSVEMSVRTIMAYGKSDWNKAAAFLR